LLFSDQIPKITVEVFKNSDDSVCFLAGRPHNADILPEQVLVIPFEIVGVKKQKNAASGLVADAAFLLCANCFGQQQATPIVCSFGPDEYPTLGIAEPCIFNEIEMELSGVERNGFIVISDYQCNVSEVRHPSMLLLSSIDFEFRVSGWNWRLQASSFALPTHSTLSAAYRLLETAYRKTAY